MVKQKIKESTAREHGKLKGNERDNTEINQRNELSKIKRNRILSKRRGTDRRKPKRTERKGKQLKEKIREEKNSNRTQRNKERQRKRS